VGRGVNSALVTVKPRVVAHTTPRSKATASLPEPLPAKARGREPRRIGVLGGTFDPPHIGHLWLATLAADELGLDRVLFVPAAQPPHKRRRRITSSAHRLLMTRLAIASDPLFELSGIEMERPGLSYTVDSMDELRRMYGDRARLFLVMAVDSLAQIDTWREPERILEIAEWGVGPRPGSAAPSVRWLRERFGAAAGRIHLLDGPGLAVSATQIRHRVAAGRAIRYLVPRAVEELIIDQGLYRRRS
jgi:nicotinate-nucleotide adenylyltransferase